jgi:hypothetical protein
VKEQQVDEIAAAIQRFRTSLVAAIAAYRTNPTAEAYEGMDHETDALIDVLGDEVLDAFDGEARG